ncbi:MAG: AlbA family DNA-binding domain-containing protein [Kiloniellales bacterium]
MIEGEMPLTGIQPRDIQEPRLQDLIIGQVPEGKTVDYKQDLPASSDGARKDFLADLCSFANAAGGYIIFGITESEGGL